MIPRQDLSGPEGTWYIKRWYFQSHPPSKLLPFSVHVYRSSDDTSYSGYSINKEGVVNEVEEITWDEYSRLLTFSCCATSACGTSKSYESYRGTVVEGIFVGRFSNSEYKHYRNGHQGTYVNHATGWNNRYFDNDIVPRVYKIVLNADYRGLSGYQCLCLLRIDRPLKRENYVGSMKVYAIGRANEWDIAREELEYDLIIDQWDGKTIRFSRTDNRPGQNWTQKFVGKVQGQNLSGTFIHEPSTLGELTWYGNRAQVLNFGICEKEDDYRKNWQERTRRQIAHLMMAGNPLPLNKVVNISTRYKSPLDCNTINRDDNSQKWPQNYILREIFFQYLLADPYGGHNITRDSHAWLAAPIGYEKSTRKFPAILALNGHYGSAWDVLQPNSMHSCSNIYWYGDAFARRGYVVLAVDISHRDDSPIYGKQGPVYGPFILDSGDDPLHGNGPHTSIKSSLFKSSDWEETGERVWDIMRAVDFLLSLSYIDNSQILVTGLSMGAEIATIVGALDDRISLVISSGWSPDSGTFYLAGHGCGNWIHADNREYVDTSDYHALIAPRHLVIQTGKEDHVWSITTPYFSADKAVARRTRIAYGDDKENFVHYLHYDDHEYHVGDLKNGLKKDGRFEPNIRVPMRIEPEPNNSQDWQTDSDTNDLNYTLFEYIESLRSNSAIREIVTRSSGKGLMSY